MRNKYAGKCLICGTEVKEGKGYFERKKGKWEVRCINCVGKKIDCDCGGKNQFTGDTRHYHWCKKEIEADKSSLTH